MREMRNERTKLLASALDRASTVIITIGFITPVSLQFFDVGSAREAYKAFSWLSGTVWLFCGVGLHFVARAALTQGLK